MLLQNKGCLKDKKSLIHQIKWVSIITLCPSSRGNFTSMQVFDVKKYTESKQKNKKRTYCRGDIVTIAPGGIDTY